MNCTLMGVSSCYKKTGGKVKAHIDGIVTSGGLVQLEILK